MKIVMSNGAEYTLPNNGGIETLMTTILKNYGYTNTMPDTAKTEDDDVVSAIGGNSKRQFAFFNAEGDDITEEVFSNSERPRIKAIYVSQYDADMWNYIRAIVPSFTYDGTDGVTSGGLYVWLSDHDVWELMSTKNLEYFEYMAKAYDCVVNALHYLKTGHNTDALAQADSYHGEPTLS